MLSETMELHSNTNYGQELRTTSAHNADCELPYPLPYSAFVPILCEVVAKNASDPPCPVAWSRPVRGPSPGREVSDSLMCPVVGQTPEIPARERLLPRSKTFPKETRRKLLPPAPLANSCGRGLGSSLVWKTAGQPPTVFLWCLHFAPGSRLSSVSSCRL